MAGNLTNDIVSEAAARDKKYWLADGVNNLYLLVMPTGKKYWKFRFRFEGKNDELTVAKPFPRGTLAMAKLEARRLQVLVDQGINPRHQRNAANKPRVAVVTFKEGANGWYEFRSKAWSVRTAKQIRAYLDKDLIPVLGRFPLDAISTEQLADAVIDITQRGAPDVAKKTRQWFKSIYEYARAKRWTTSDPVKDLHAITYIPTDAQRYAHLPIKDLPKFLRVLDELDASPFVKGAAYLALWTANRPGVTRTLRWSEVDFEQGVWAIEPRRDEMKLGYRHVTPLPKQAITLLTALRELSGTFDYVFIGRNDPSKPISDGAVASLIKRMGYRGKQTMHGFRHVLSSALNGQGYEADWIERQLAHGDPDRIRGIYNSAPYLDQRRRMLQNWADIMDRMRDDTFVEV